jgi:hypothetical protein
MKRKIIAITIIFFLVSGAKSQIVEEIVVWGRGTELLGNVYSASEGVVGYSDFSERPLMRVGELTEVIPGMMATQHSGSGKANQYFLRGMNLDHGSDFSVHLDGLPVNFRSHAHAQGYLDLNIMIPEIVERVRFKKGPYFSDEGDFSLAGSAKFKTYDSLEESFIEVQTGSHHDYRLVAARSDSINWGTLLLASEFHRRDGPWELNEDLEKINLFLKLTSIKQNVNQSSVISIYDASWMGTDQIPQRTILDGGSRFGYVDSDIGGQSHRYSLVHTRFDDIFSFNFYATRYGLNLYSNPTYYLNDVISGDEIEQEDQRFSYGSSGYRFLGKTFFPANWDIRIGYEVQYDNVQKLNLFQTASRKRLNTLKSDTVTVASFSMYIENELLVSDIARIRFGYRMDHHRFDIESTIVQNSGSQSEMLGQPKFSVAYPLSDGFELYLGWGKGFHSNDARGTTINIDPISEELVSSVNVFASGKGSEIGFRFEKDESFNIAINYFHLDLDSELVFVGDAGTTEPTDGSRRSGIEFSSFWELAPGLAIDLSGSSTDGKYTGTPVEQSYIPDAHDFTLSAGITKILSENSSFTFRLRHFGDAPLLEDNSIRKDGTTLVNFSLSIPFYDDHLTFEILNLLDAKDNDISYYFESKLADEVSGIEDIHFHPVESRAFRLSYKRTF